MYSYSHGIFSISHDELNNNSGYMMMNTNSMDDCSTYDLSSTNYCANRMISANLLMGNGEEGEEDAEDVFGDVINHNEDEDEDRYNANYTLKHHINLAYNHSKTHVISEANHIINGGLRSTNNDSSISKPSNHYHIEANCAIPNNNNNNSNNNKSGELQCGHDDLLYVNGLSTNNGHGSFNDSPNHDPHNNIKYGPALIMPTEDVPLMHLYHKCVGNKNPHGHHHHHHHHHHDNSVMTNVSGHDRLVVVEATTSEHEARSLVAVPSVNTNISPASDNTNNNNNNNKTKHKRKRASSGSSSSPPSASSSRSRVVGSNSKKKKKNSEELENQRMTHIAVERNRRRQMNEHLTALRSMMPSSYVQRGDQASIVGGAIRFVEELEQLVQCLHIEKQLRSTTNHVETPITSFSHFNVELDIDSNIRAPLSHFGFTEDTPDITRDGSYAASSSSVASIEVNMQVSSSSAFLKVLAHKMPHQLFHTISAFTKLYLKVVHLNITTVNSTTILYSFNLKMGDDCQLQRPAELVEVVQNIFNVCNNGGSEQPTY